jgi:TonB family protein
MSKSMRFCYLLIVLCFAASGLSAQDKPISGGLLNGKAVSLPKPAYPAIAKAARACGTVSVQVTIDESGSVISVRAISGHPLLQAAAVEAAKQAKFAPTLLDGNPVKVTGVINYNFVPEQQVVINDKGEAETVPCVSNTDGASDETAPATPVNGGVLNGRAIKLLKPEYPAAAKEAGIEGAVKVRVVIDEAGNVVTAEAVSGPEQLHASCVSAALGSEFTPTKLKGQPVKVAGYIIYNFVAK